ncbi:MAG: FkbM family methyltransferase [bacterium]
MTDSLRWIRSRFCPPPLRHSFGLNGLDLKLAPYLKKHGGFFIEAGANDGVSQTNTLYFERYRGWTGLLVEPVPELAARCRVNRPRCIVESCALVASDAEPKSITIKCLGLMSQIPGAQDKAEEQRHETVASQHLKRGQQPCLVEVPTRTLSSILDAHGVKQIDLLSLDVEGYEPQVLGGLDFQRHRPGHILIEVRDEKLIRSRLDPYYRLLTVLDTNDDYADMLFVAR